MNPSHWYQWFDADQPDDPDSWRTITVDHSSNDAIQDATEFMGSNKSIGDSFLSLKFGGGGSEEMKIEAGDSYRVKSFIKARAVEIRRPWVDLSALNFENWKIPGLPPGAWSTGVLDSSNDGSFPLLTTQMIVAKEITTTAEGFSKEIIDALTRFDADTGTGLLHGFLRFGLGDDGGFTKETHKFHCDFDGDEHRINVKGTQVIGYVGTLVRKYPE